MKTELFTKVSAITIPTLIGFVAGGAILATAYAHNEDGFRYSNLTTEQQEVFEQVRELRQEGDFDEAQKLAQDAGLPEKHHFGMQHKSMTDEQKSVLEQIRTLREEGNFEEARALSEEFELDANFRGKEGNQEIRDAIESNDYDAYKELTAEAPFADQVDSSFFEKVVEAHEYMQSGDHESARDIMEELGIHEFRGGGRSLK